MAPILRTQFKVSYSGCLAKRIFIAVLAFFPLVSGCANMSLPKPPLFTPFEAQKAGSIVTTELRVVEHRYYEFTLYLHIKEGGNTEDSKRLMKLAGWPTVETDQNGKQYINRTSIAIPVKLTISVIDTSDERIIYDKTIHDEKLQSGGGGAYEKIIDSVELRPGHYRITIQSMQNIPEFAEYPISLGIHGRHNTNPID